MPRDEWGRATQRARYGPVRGKGGGDTARPIYAPTRACPRCGAVMVLRVNKSSGETFLGCSDFPQCRGTAPHAAGTPLRAKKPKKKKRKGRQRNPHVTEADRHMASLGVANLLAKSATLTPPTPPGQDPPRPAARTARGEVVF